MRIEHGHTSLCLLGLAADVKRIAAKLIKTPHDQFIAVSGTRSYRPD